MKMERGTVHSKLFNTSDAQINPATEDKQDTLIAKDFATETTLAAVKTAVETIDNFISGTKGLVTEDNSAAIKTAVELIDNFISGARGLVTEDNSASILTQLQNIDAGKVEEATFTSRVGEVQASPTANTLLARLKSIEDKLDTLETTNNAVQAAVAVIDNFISGTKGLVTEDSAAAIKTAVETIDNFISGARGLVTEDNSAAALTALQLIDNMIAGNEAQVDIVTDQPKDRTVDNQGVALQTDAIMNDTTVLTPKFAIIDAET